MRKLFEIIPWGIVAGVSGILFFYCTGGVIAAQFIAAQVNGQTGQAATIFDTWWQVLLFAGVIVTVIIFAGSLALFVLKKIQRRKGGTHVEKLAK